MSVIMIVAEMSYFWRLLHLDLDANVYDHLPITICGIANVICAFMLLTKSKKCFDIVYFWCSEQASMRLSRQRF